MDGLADDGLHPLQRAFSELHALQCGFCTPGFLLAAKELLEQHPEPSTLSGAEVREHLSGNICRCTGYHNIVAAVLRVAGAEPESTAAPSRATEESSR
ncbi:MAG: (2Fe-2S)-binding protein [Ilumatobacteraceae bacterium]